MAGKQGYISTAFNADGKPSSITGKFGMRWGDKRWDFAESTVSTSLLKPGNENIYLKVGQDSLLPKFLGEIITGEDSIPYVTSRGKFRIDSSDESKSQKETIKEDGWTQKGPYKKDIEAMLSRGTEGSLESRYLDNKSGIEVNDFQGSLVFFSGPGGINAFTDNVDFSIKHKASIFTSDVAIGGGARVSIRDGDIMKIRPLDDASSIFEEVRGGLTYKRDTRGDLIFGGVGKTFRKQAVMGEDKQGSIVTGWKLNDVFKKITPEQTKEIDAVVENRSLSQEQRTQEINQIVNPLLNEFSNEYLFGAIRPVLSYKADEQGLSGTNSFILSGDFKTIGEERRRANMPAELTQEKSENIRSVSGVAGMPEGFNRGTFKPASFIDRDGKERSSDYNQDNGMLTLYGKGETPFVLAEPTLRGWQVSFPDVGQFGLNEDFISASPKIGRAHV